MFSVSALTTDAATCKREYKKTGCFKRNEKIFKHLLITDLDPTHHKWGEDIDWADYHASLHRFETLKLFSRNMELSRKDANQI